MRIVVMCLLVLFFYVSPLGLAQSLSQPKSLSSEDVAALALYDASSPGAGSLADNLVNYNVTDPAVIDSVLSGIELGVQRDCSLMQTVNSAHLYVKFKDATRKVYDLFLLNSHLSIVARRDPCFFFNEASRAILLAYKQD